MAYDVTKLTKLSALKATAQKVADTFATKTELTNATADLSSTFKSGNVSGNTVSFYTSKDGTGTAAFTFDFPTEMFLDQTKTVFVDSFTWTETAYPGSTNPSLEGKPVMVLAVKGDDDSVTYSFLSMATLVDTYTAKVTGKDASTTVTISGYEVDVKVNISAESDNQLEAKDDGLYVPKFKVANATSGDFASLDANGYVVDSGKKAADFVAAEEGKGLSTNDYTTAEKTKLAGIADAATKVETTDTSGVIKINGTEVTLYEVASDDEITEMLNEVIS